VFRGGGYNAAVGRKGWGLSTRVDLLNAGVAPARQSCRPSCGMMLRRCVVSRALARAAATSGVMPPQVASQRRNAGESGRRRGHRYGRRRGSHARAHTHTHMAMPGGDGGHPTWSSPIPPRGDEEASPPSPGPRPVPPPGRPGDFSDDKTPPGLTALAPPYGAVDVAKVLPWATGKHSSAGTPRTPGKAGSPNPGARASGRGCRVGH
jgi:hypothetical protein